MWPIPHVILRTDTKHFLSVVPHLFGLFPYLPSKNPNLFKFIEMEGKGCFGSFIQTARPYVAMVSLQFGYAGMNIITKVSLNRGMSHYVLVVYRHAFATAVIAPFALIIER